MNTHNSNTAATTSKKAYVKPALKKIGSVAQLTLKGGSQTDSFSNFTP